MRILKSILSGLALVLALGIGASAQTQTVTGTIDGLGGAGCPGGTSGTSCFVRFRLRNYAGTAPRVVGTGILAPLQLDVIPNGSGAFTTSLYPNDVIQPNTCNPGGATPCTWYSVDFYQGGQEKSSQNWQFVGAGPFNLSSLAPMTATIPPPPPFLAVLLNPLGNQVIGLGNLSMPSATVNLFEDVLTDGAPGLPAAGYCRASFNGTNMVFKNSAGGDCSSGGGGGGGTVTGSGTSGWIPIWTSPSSLGTSDMQDSATHFLNVGSIGVPMDGGTAVTVNSSPAAAQSCNASPATFPRMGPNQGCKGLYVQTQPQAASANTSNAGLFYNQGSNTLTNQIGASGIVFPSDTSPNAIGLYGECYSGGSGFVNPMNCHGVFGYGENGSVGTSPTNDGITASSGIVGGTTTNDYSLHVLAPSLLLSGIFTHHYGLMIEDQTGAGGGTNSDPHGLTVKGGGIQTLPRAFSTLPACNSNNDGRWEEINDSPVVAWGGQVTVGGSTNHVWVGCNGTKWLVYLADSNTSAASDRDFSATGCTTASSTDSSCTGSITISPAYPDNAYIPVLTPNSNNGAFIAVSVSGALVSNSIPYTITCTFNCASIVAPTIYVHTHRP